MKSARLRVGWSTRLGNGQVAQLVEQWTENPCVVGSIPTLPIKETPRRNAGRFALVAGENCKISTFNLRGPALASGHPHLASLGLAATEDWIKIARPSLMQNPRCKIDGASYFTDILIGGDEIRNAVSPGRFQIQGLIDVSGRCGHCDLDDMGVTVEDRFGAAFTYECQHLVEE